MFTDAEDWLARLKEAGGTVRIGPVTMWPEEHDRGVALSPECEAIWAEIRGIENLHKWRQVQELVRSKVGPTRARMGGLLIGKAGAPPPLSYHAPDQRADDAAEYEHERQGHKHEHREHTVPFESIHGWCSSRSTSAPENI
jgi:hypothetical protein